MEKNDFLLYNEVVYRIHACQTMEELKPALLAQIKLLVPYTYASLIPIAEDPESQEAVHGEPFCKPRQFESVEKQWVEQIDQSYTLWLSHAVESMVVRDSEVMSDSGRFSAWSYRDLYSPYNIIDCVQMNIAYGNRVMGRLALYRTKADGLFTEREDFYLRSLANHINLAYWTCRQKMTATATEGRSLAQLGRDFGLTRREEEILGLIFQDMNNNELLEKLSISKNTLLKHLQNLYRKCGVSSRWDLLKLRSE